MKNTSKILEKIVYTIIILVAILLVWSILPVKNGPKILAVLSGSMEPAIHTGSVVVIKPESQYNINDVVTFGKDTKKDVPTTHRIVSSRVQDGVMVFKTQGDANNAPDSTEIRQSDIHGKVLFSVPLVGYIIDFVRQPIGLVLVIVLPAIFIVYDEVRKIMAEVKKMRKPKPVVDQEKNV
jgi:signal peptidase